MALDLKALLGDQYSDDLTKEQLLDLIQGIDYVDPSTVVSVDEYNRIKSANDNLSKESKAWKSKYNSTLSEQEQLKNAQEEAQMALQKKYDELLQKTQTMEYTSDLLAVGYSEKLAKEGAEALANGDMKSFMSIQKKFADSVRKDERSVLLKQTPEPDGGSSNAIITKNDIRKMSIEEQAKFAEENPDEYNAIYAQSSKS